MTYTLENLIDIANSVSMAIAPGVYVPARSSQPSGLFGLKMRARSAWLVFTGRADAVIWPVGQ